MASVSGLSDFIPDSLQIGSLGSILSAGSFSSSPWYLQQAQRGLHMGSMPILQSQLTATQARLQAEAFNQSFASVSLNHLGQVKYMRKRFKDVSKEDFHKMSKDPLVKDILKGMASIPIDEVADRIQEHIDTIK